MKKIIPVFLVMLVLCGAGRAQEFSSEAGRINVTTIAKGLAHPWSIVFLPDGRMLVTERAGRLRIVTQQGAISEPIKNVPAVFDEGQGGLLDLALDPDFAKNQTVYFSFADKQGDVAGTAVGKGQLKDNVLENVQIIFRQTPKVKGGNHFGSRLAFGRDGTLFITMGERFDYSEKAQTLDTHMGKVVRIKTDGTIPADNPFVNQKGALPEIWSYGHRNVQGAAINPETGDLWTAEHGPRGGDEINLDVAGKNYGWPEASYGSHYSMLPIPDDHASRGFVEPLYHWNPSISPSGMVFYTGDLFPSWKGHVFTGSLNGMALVNLTLDKQKIVKEERLLQDMNERIRDVEQGPDGALYLVTDSDDGRVLRVAPSR